MLRPLLGRGGARAHAGGARGDDRAPARRSGASRHHGAGAGRSRRRAAGGATARWKVSRSSPRRRRIAVVSCGGTRIETRLAAALADIAGARESMSRRRPPSRDPDHPPWRPRRSRRASRRRLEDRLRRLHDGDDGLLPGHVADIGQRQDARLRRPLFQSREARRRDDAAARAERPEEGRFGRHRDVLLPARTRAEKADKAKSEGSRQAGQRRPPRTSPRRRRARPDARSGSTRRLPRTPTPRSPRSPRRRAPGMRRPIRRSRAARRCSGFAAAISSAIRSRRRRRQLTSADEQNEALAAITPPDAPAPPPPAAEKAGQGTAGPASRQAARGRQDRRRHQGGDLPPR